MKLSLGFCRRALKTSAILLIIVAAILLWIVIPAVRADAFPQATPDRAATAFKWLAAFNFFAAIVLGFIGYITRGRNGLITTLLGFLGIAVLFLVIGLVDAGFAFHGHGPAMRKIAVVIFLCAGAQMAAGFQVMLSGLFQPKPQVNVVELKLPLHFP